MARTYRRLWVATLAACLLLLILVAVFSTLRTAPFPPDPSPNGYFDLVAAGSAVPSEVFNYQAFDEASLRELVTTNGDSLKLLRRGLGRQCALPRSAATNFASVAAELPRIKRLAQLLAAEGRLAELENRPLDAARSYVDAIRLGNEVSRRGLLIHRLVGVACEAIGSMPLGKLLGSLNPKQAHAVSMELQQIDRASVTWAEVVRSERLFARREMWKTSPLALPKDLWQGWQITRKCKPRHDQSVARVRLLAVELAVRSYTAENGMPPRSLEELVPKHLESVPEDPFAAKPVTYRAQGTNWLVYSVGQDRTDDGGARTGRGAAKGDVFFDSL